MDGILAYVTLNYKSNQNAPPIIRRANFAFLLLFGRWIYQYNTVNNNPFFLNPLLFRALCGKLVFMEQPMSKPRAHYVLSTHWDREWYQHFQDYRYRLVQLLDHVLEGWRSKRLRGPFQTDGQAIILEDYLEIRPERRAEVRRRAREGRLVIGPWYVLPDEFLVSGESLIRNLQLGRSIAREWGAQPSSAGFVCDEFGHNSQMPQIFAGFGFRGAFVWRGTNLVDQRLFIWRGADGTELLTYRFGPEGYCDYARFVRACHRKDLPFDPAQARANLQTFLQAEAAHTPAHTLLLFDGGDHMGWDDEAYAVLLERMALPDNRFEIVHTSLDAYLVELTAEAPLVETVIEGELREPALHPTHIDHQWLTPGVLASRVWIKQSNARCQSLLCQWAEPFSALAAQALGREVPRGFLNAAWKSLLQNHPHDSISGCSIDAVHEDMKFRFAQAKTLAQRLAREALLPIAASVQGSVAENELRVAVFNPLAVPLEQPVDVTLEIPVEWPTYHEMEIFEPRPAFRIFTHAGAELPYQFLGQIPNRKRFRTYPNGFPRGYSVHEVRVSIPLRIPALGYTTLTVRAGEMDIPTRYPVTPGLASSERSLENEFLAVTVESNGSLTVLDKRSGQTCTRWLTFEDCADIGDGWNFGPASNDQRFTSAASSASVALAFDGLHMAALRIRTVMELPAAFDFANNARQVHFERLVIDFDRHAARRAAPPGGGNHRAQPPARSPPARALPQRRGWRPNLPGRFTFRRGRAPHRFARR